MKKFLSLSSAILLFLGVLAGCTMMKSGSEDKETKSVASEEELEPFGKYEETVTYTLGKNTPGIPKLPEGQTYEDNAYTRYLKETLNVQNENKFEVPTGSAYDQKVSMAIVSGDLPDIMQVGESTLKELVENDLIADLTDVYQSSTTDYIKKVYDSYDDRALDAAKFDGKLMAMPVPAVSGHPTMLWIRQDWLDKLGLDAPKTVDDLEKVLTEFVEKDPGNNGKGNTIGLGLSKSVGGLYGTLFQADNIFATYNSFPRQWIEQDGKVIYGSITDETKQGLGKLADWYEKGLIDPQVAVRDSIESIIISGQVGAFFGPWWSADYPLNSARQKNPNADWQPYMISNDGSGTVTCYTGNPAVSFLVVRKGYEHPEILPKIASALNDKLNHEDRDYQPVVDFIKGGYDGGIPVPIGIAPYDQYTKRMYENLKGALDGEIGLDELTIEDQAQFQKIKDYLKDPSKADANQWSGYMSRMVAGKLMAGTKVNEVNPVFFGQTRSMELKWANLTKLEDETFLKILTGEEDLKYFDKFVETWKSTGGNDITNEVSEAVEEK
ncbi:extracellular solute-binding protein [Bacillaceae bacterium Marseille-Q3522]|nr:extracellular solute-binding protein [Bacillaceae bacterium Marseille-Q3522]